MIFVTCVLEFTFYMILVFYYYGPGCNLSTCGHFGSGRMLWKRRLLTLL